jgi:hypothetical protein
MKVKDLLLWKDPVHSGQVVVVILYLINLFGSLRDKSVVFHSPVSYLCCLATIKLAASFLINHLLRMWRFLTHGPFQPHNHHLSQIPYNPSDDLAALDLRAARVAAVRAGVAVTARNLTRHAEDVAAAWTIVIDYFSGRDLNVTLKVAVGLLSLATLSEVRVSVLLLAYSCTAALFTGPLLVVTVSEEMELRSTSVAEVLASYWAATRFRVLPLLFGAFVVHLCTSAVTQIMLGFVAALAVLVYLQHRQLRPATTLLRLGQDAAVVEYQ